MTSILLIISVVLALISIGYSIFVLIKFIKDLRAKSIDKKLFLNLLVPVIIISFAMLGINLGRKILGGWDMEPLHIILTILGSLLFAGSCLIFVDCFILRYYKKNPDLDPKQRHIASIMMFSSIPVIFCSLLVMLEGIAPYVTYPLTNGFSLFTTEGFFVFTRYGEASPVSALPIDIHVQWYGLIIVSGAVLVYFISDHKLYKIYKQHGLLDTCFIIAFPMGIIGARLWFCFVLKPDYYLANPGDIIRIWDGGLAVQGGVLLGIASGVTYMLIFKKFVEIRECVDIVVPTILIAQAIGRWGNLFNHEVYGEAVNISEMWFVPTFIKNQMFVPGEPDKMYFPLYLLESVINLSGYFIITKLIKELLGKVWKYPKGSISALYLVWYGIVRVILEPFRKGGSGEQDQFDQSVYTAIAFIVIGVAIIGLLYLWDYAIAPAIKRNKENKKA